jgi:hypothetical protein
MSGSRLVKRGRVAAWVVAGVALAYLIGVNAFLNLALPRLISSERLLIRWDRAWTFWPGLARVRGFYLCHRQSDVEWELSVDEARIDVVLSALLKNRFETSWVKARGVAFRLRPRVFQSEISTAATNPHPPLKGFPDPPLRVYTVKPSDGSSSRPWSVQLEGAHVDDLRELGLGAFRFQGRATIEGRMHLVPRERFEVGPLRLSLAQGGVSLGPTQMLQEMRGGLSTTFVIPSSRSEDETVLDQLNGTVQLKANVPSLRFLNALLEGHPLPELDGGGGRFEGELALTRGKLQPSTKVSIEGEELTTQLPPYRLRVGWSAEGTVRQKGDALVSELVFDLPNLRLEREGGVPWLSSPRLVLRLTGTDVVLGELPADAALSLKLDRTAPADLKLLNAWLETQSVEVKSGMVSVAGDLTLGPGLQKGGTLSLRTGPSLVRWDNSLLAGMLLLDVNLARMKLERQGASLSGTVLELKDVAVQNRRAIEHGWNGKVVLEEATLRLRPKLTASARVNGTFSDARPFLALFGDRAGLPRWTTPFFIAEGLTVQGRFKLQRGDLRLRELNAQGKNLRIRGALDRVDSKVRGVFLTSVQFLTAAQLLEEGKGKLQWIRPAEWYAGKLQALVRADE